MNRKTIIKMLEYCGMSYNNYQSADVNEDVTLINDKETDIQCFARVKNSVLTLIFRGSDSKKDWGVDAKFWKSIIPYNSASRSIKAHAGFVGTYGSEKFRNTIYSLIKDNINKIYITGHSYGAALAILCASDLEHSFPKKDYEVIVFGCPRVGNRAFKDSYNLRLFKTLRIENRCDIVTKVPFGILGYRHVGTAIKIGNGSFWGLVSMKNHSLQEYYSNIWGV